MGRGFFVLLSCIFISKFAFALPEGAPHSFLIDGRERAVFVDFQKATYKITYDLHAKKTWVDSEIEFLAEEAGFPIFDLVDTPSKVFLDNHEEKQSLELAPQNKTKYRVVRKRVEAGAHRLHILHRLSSGVIFRFGKVDSGFWFNDLDDRQFLELYLPSNLEYDQYAMTYEIKIVGAKPRVEDTPAVKIFTNGKLLEIGENEWKISFPEYFNSSAPFFHLLSTGSFQELNEKFLAKDGREIPVTVYGKNSDRGLKPYMDEALKTLTELDEAYGPFPHSSLTVYAVSSYGGGMEYCGATITNLPALSHEITHSYFGRGLMPANGNAGWIDEALASWRDNGYARVKAPGYSFGNLGAFSEYRRTTPTDAYTLGAAFMSYLDSLLSARASKDLKAFLREGLRMRTFKPWTTESFENFLESYYGSSLSSEFSQYVFGQKRLPLLSADERLLHGLRHRFHPVWSVKALEQFI